MDIKLKLFLLFCVIDNSNATNLKNRNLYNNQNINNDNDDLTDSDVKFLLEECDKNAIPNINSDNIRYIYTLIQNHNACSKFFLDETNLALHILGLFIQINLQNQILDNEKQINSINHIKYNSLDNFLIDICSMKNQNIPPRLIDFLNKHVKTFKFLKTLGNLENLTKEELIRIASHFDVDTITKNEILNYYEFFHNIFNHLLGEEYDNFLNKKDYNLGESLKKQIKNQDILLKGSLFIFTKFISKSQEYKLMNTYNNTSYIEEFKDCTECNQEEIENLFLPKTYKALKIKLDKKHLDILVMAKKLQKFAEEKSEEFFSEERNVIDQKSFDVLEYLYIENYFDKDSNYKTILSNIIGNKTENNEELSFINETENAKKNLTISINAEKDQLNTSLTSNKNQTTTYIIEKNDEYNNPKCVKCVNGDCRQYIKEEEKIEAIVDYIIEQKEEEKIEAIVEEKIEAIVEEKIEDLIEQKKEEKIEAIVEEKIEAIVEEKIEDLIEQKEEIEKKIEKIVEEQEDLKEQDYKILSLIKKEQKQEEKQNEKIDKIVEEQKKEQKQEEKQNIAINFLQNQLQELENIIKKDEIEHKIIKEEKEQKQEEKENKIIVKEEQEIIEEEKKLKIIEEENKIIKKEIATVLDKVEEIAKLNKELKETLNAKNTTEMIIKKEKEKEKDVFVPKKPNSDDDLIKVIEEIQKNLTTVKEEREQLKDFHKKIKKEKEETEKNIKKMNSELENSMSSNKSISEDLKNKKKEAEEIASKAQKIEKKTEEALKKAEEKQKNIEKELENVKKEKIKMEQKIQEKETIQEKEANKEIESDEKPNGTALTAIAGSVAAMAVVATGINDNNEFQGAAAA